MSGTNLDSTLISRMPSNEACTSCKKRKKRCDREKPCKHCRQRGVQCVTVDPARRTRGCTERCPPAASEADNVQTILDRVEGLCRLLESILREISEDDRKAEQILLAIFDLVHAELSEVTLPTLEYSKCPSRECIQKEMDLQHLATLANALRELSAAYKVIFKGHDRPGNLLVQLFPFFRALLGVRRDRANTSQETAEGEDASGTHSPEIDKVEHALSPEGSASTAGSAMLATRQDSRLPPQKAMQIDQSSPSNARVNADAVNADAVNHNHTLNDLPTRVTSEGDFGPGLFGVSSISHSSGLGPAFDMPPHTQAFNGNQTSIPSMELSDAQVLTAPMVTSDGFDVSSVLPVQTTSYSNGRSDVATMMPAESLRLSSVADGSAHPPDYYNYDLHNSWNEFGFGWDRSNISSNVPTQAGLNALDARASWRCPRPARSRRQAFRVREDLNFHSAESSTWQAQPPA